MARTIVEIKKEMTDAFLADETLKLKYGFDPTKSFDSQFSKVSLESIIFYIVACSIWVLEVIFDKHRDEVEDIISKRAHTLAWYREKALNFQFGCDLRDDICEYDNSNLTDEQIEASKIIKKCSCEMVDAVFPSVKVKVNGADGNITHDQYVALKAYMQEIADAGVKINVVAQMPDKLGLTLTIMYDPLVMNAQGTLYNEGIENAVNGYITDYLNSLEFNGDFIPNMLESYLMSRAGIKVANISVAKVKPEYGQMVDITGLMRYSPASGAFVFDNSIDSFLTIIYKEFTNE